ncbi:MAG: phosphoribosylanthranilate isomerase [Candidatus Brocadiaceae bacterium]|nr:phosphoribosylanthranilate isomerase [Candidatus Brocadiaceae bacterium]
MKVKICGITNSEDAQNAIAFGADALGFIFAESPRRITKELARAIIKDFPPFVTPVGVFVDEETEALKEICRFCHINTVQLHGDEPPSYLNELEGYKTIKAFRIREEHDLKALPNFHSDAYLLDSYVKGGAMGGTGVVFKWEHAKQAHTCGAVILSGGLTPENVKEAIRAVKPYAVDVCSGVESAPGRKNRILLKQFIINAKF